MEKEAESIRRAARARDKQRYSPELKARIIAYVEQRRAVGASQSTVAQEVGVKWMTTIPSRSFVRYDFRGT